MFSAISSSGAFFPALMAAIAGVLSPSMANAVLVIPWPLAYSTCRLSLGSFNVMHSVRTFFLIISGTPERHHF